MRKLIKKIFEQDKIINSLNKIESPIEDNELFKSLKEKNKQLEMDLNDYKNFDKQSIIDEITLSLESKFLTEKQEIKNEYNDIINNVKNEKDKTINNLKKQLNHNIKKGEKIIKNKNDKYSDDNLLNSIIVYDNFKKMFL